MGQIGTEKVLEVKHWNDTLFSFRTSRDRAFRFESGQFVMVGLEVEGRPLLRAYSIASAHYDEDLEFFSIKVPDGPLTSRLQHINPGDPILIGKKPTGTLVLTDLLPGKRLYMIAGGTGLAPFLSVIRDPDVYERFDEVILVHSVKYRNELAYADYLTTGLAEHEFVGEEAAKKFVYYPTVTREDPARRSRVTHLIVDGRLAADLGVPNLNPETDRVMICSGVGMLNDTSALLDSLGFKVSAGIGRAGDYVIERAFVEK
ncbi:MAG: ferredoxin--NADP reductase [Hyphomonadaceae bacterium]|nr:ferredoxin--NADP reductase [Hyphomonadaceae bacterium]